MRGRQFFGFNLGLLTCFGFGLLLMGAFPTDPPGAEATVHGTVHLLAAIGSFWVFFVSILLLLPTLKRDEYWKDIYRYTVATAAIALILGVGQLWMSAHSRWFGLYERIVVGNTVIWIEVMAFRLLQLSLGKYPEVKNPARSG